MPGQTRPAERYLVDIEDADAACTCPDFELRRHQHAVLFWIAWGRDVNADGSVTETVVVTRRTYPQKNWSAYNASQHHEREYVERLLRALCAGIVQPPRTLPALVRAVGRQRALCAGIVQPPRKPGPGRNARLLSDLVFSAVMKVYLMFSGRRTQLCGITVGASASGLPGP